MRRVYFILIILSAFFLTSCSNSNNEQTDNTTIKGISSATLYDALESKGFRIDKQIEADAMFVDCDRTGTEASEHVRIAGSGPGAVEEIRASYTNYTKSNTVDAANQFLCFIASVPYNGSNPEEAKRWIRENITKGGKTTIGGVIFELTSQTKTSSVFTLLITPK